MSCLRQTTTFLAAAPNLATPGKQIQVYKVQDGGAADARTGLAQPCFTSSSAACSLWQVSLTPRGERLSLVSVRAFAFSPQRCAPARSKVLSSVGDPPASFALRSCSGVLSPPPKMFLHLLSWGNFPYSREERRFPNTAKEDQVLSSRVVLRIRE